MRKALDAILVMTTLAILATVVAFLATQSLKAAMILTWAPVAFGGTYAIGKAHGKQKTDSASKH